MYNKIKLFERHLREEEKAESTINKYLQDVKEFYRWLDVNSIHNITKEELLDYKEHLKNSNLKVTSINSKISSLNSYLIYSENKTLKLKVIKCQKTLFGSKEKELTKNEYKKLYEASKNNKKVKLIIETMVRTGIRVSELQYITYESLMKGKAEINNKGKIRTVLIPRKLCIKLLDYYRSNRKVEQNYSDKSKNIGELCEYVFVTKNGNYIDRKQIWKMLKNLADKAGLLKEKVFPHNLRHLFAHEFYKSTHDIVKLASILGHSSIETTRIYTKETEDECRIDMDKLEFAIN